jgi:hypothetical protein
MVPKHPEDKLSYSEALTTHYAIEQALQGVYHLQARTPHKTIWRYLPGICLPVLQQHLALSGVFNQSLLAVP